MNFKEGEAIELEKVFFETSEYATSATLTTSGPTISTVSVIFHKEVTVVDPFTGDVDADIGLPHALGIATDFSAAKQNDTLLIDGDTYKINRVVDDDIGQALIWFYTT